MIATSASVQELAWRDAIRSVKGRASYLPRISRPVANRLLVAAGSRGEANLRPISLDYRDVGESALEALAAGLGKNLETKPDDNAEASLDALTLAIRRTLIETKIRREVSESNLSSSSRLPTSKFELYDRPFAFDERVETFEPTTLTSRDIPMPKPTWFTTDKVITGLLAVSATFLGLIATLIGVLYFNVKSDIDDLKKVSLDMPKQISDLKVSVISSVKDVEKQAAIANSRLDLILEELKRPQRR